MKVYLQSQDDSSQLYLRDRKTTIGKDGTDITLKSLAIEKTHAIIEHDSEDNALYLQDLNTAHGTYVNGVRIQNAVVRIAQGDIIRFGHAGPSYEVCIASSINKPIHYPPIVSHQAWESQANGVIDFGKSNASTMLPQLPYSSGSSQSFPNPATSLMHIPRTAVETLVLQDGFNGISRGNIIPRPPSRSRPSSAGIQSRPKNSHNVEAHHANVNGNGLNSIICRAEENADSRVLELEQRLLKMGDELSRLAVFEAECFRKDGVIVALRSEIADINATLHGNNQQLSTPSSNNGLTRISAAAVKHLQDENVHLNREILHLRSLFNEKETHLESHRTELMTLQNQLQMESDTATKLQHEMNNLRIGQSNINQRTSQNETNSIAKLHTEITSKNHQIAVLQVELDKVAKQRSQSALLVNTLQKDAVTKDKVIAKGKADIDKLRREFRDKENSITSLTLKLSKLKSVDDLEKDCQKKNEEIKSLKNKLRSSEAQQRGVTAQLANVLNNFQQARTEKAEDDRVADSLRKEIHYLRSQFIELERQEKTAQTKAVETENKMELFRQHVDEAIFSCGYHRPHNNTLSNEDIYQLVRNLAKDQSSLLMGTNELRLSQEKQDSVAKETDDMRVRMNRHMELLEKRLIKGGRTCDNLDYEVAMLERLESPERLRWTKDAISNLLSQEMTWEQEIEDALRDAGIDILQYKKETPDLIKILATKADGVQVEMNDLKDRISMMEETHRKSMMKLKDQLHQDKENAVNEAIAIAKAEERRHRDELIAETRRLDLEKLEQLQAHTDLTESENISNLEKAAMQAKRLAEERNEEILSLQDELEHLKMSLKKAIESEREMRVQLEETNEQLQSTNRRLSTIQQETQERTQYEIASYKEQAMQHSLTIVALEDRLVLVNREKATLEMELAHRASQLGQAVSVNMADSDGPTPMRTSYEIEASNRNDDVRKIAELEETVSSLRDQLDEIQAEYSEQCRVAIELREDLAKAYAKATDAAADVDERLKEQLEFLAEQVKNKDDEIYHTREELAHFASLNDKQEAEIASLSHNLNEQQHVISRYEAEVESTRSQKQPSVDTGRELVAYDDGKGHVDNELKGIASACLSDRHELVISRQKEAIAEYRTKLRMVEQRKHSLPSYDYTVKQMEALKSELSLVKSDLAYRNDDLLKNETDLQKEVRVTRELLQCAKQEFNIERSAHEHSKEALGTSEDLFIDMLRSLATSLGISIIPGCKTITNVSSSERQEVKSERQEALQLILSKIKLYKDRVERKEQLLSEYENDLVQLRDSKTTADHQEQETRALMATVHDYRNEISFLQEALRQAREKIQQQKRLSTTLTSRSELDSRQSKSSKNAERSLK